MAMVSNMGEIVKTKRKPLEIWACLVMKLNLMTIAWNYWPRFLRILK